jgi:uncharacterized protein (UPF0333 family)
MAGAYMKGQASIAKPLASARCLRGQASMELLITLGVVIAFTIPVVLLLLSVSSVGYEKAAKDQADASARSLADSINNVYAQGDGARRVVLLNAPSTTKEISIGGGEVVVKIKTSSGDYDGTAPIFANVSGLPTVTGKAGLMELNVTNANGQVFVNG